MLFPPAISSKYMNFKLLKDFLKIFPQIYVHNQTKMNPNLKFMLAC